MHSARWVAAAVLMTALHGCPADTEGDAGAGIGDGGSAQGNSKDAATASNARADAATGSPAADGGSASIDAGTMSSDAGSSDAGDAAASCGGAVCEPHQVCVLVQVQCITTPCPPLPTCIDDPCATVRCKAGTKCVATEDGASCEPFVADDVPCGKNTCSGGQVCCNASCGICTPPDSACIQIACE